MLPQPHNVNVDTESEADKKSDYDVQFILDTISHNLHIDLEYTGEYYCQDDYTLKQVSLNNTDDPIDNIDNADDKHLDDTDRDDTGCLYQYNKQKEDKMYPQKLKRQNEKFPATTKNTMKKK